MRSLRRKQRFQSEPLPYTRDDQESPDGDLDDRSPNSSDPSRSSRPHHSLRLPLDPHSKQIQSGTAMTFPLTPTSAAGEAERALTTPSSITNNAPSDRQHRAPEPYSRPDKKMDEQSSINSFPDLPPQPADPATSPSTTAVSVRAPANTNGPSSTSSSTSRTMSHRVENIPIRPRPFHETHPGHYYSAHPSPPPITTLTHSPSLSSDRSSVSSPAPTILPPLTHPAQVSSHSYLSSGQHRYSNASQPGAYHHSQYYGSTVAPPDVFASPISPYTHNYSSGYPPPPPTHVSLHSDVSLSSSQHYSPSPYASVGSMYTHHGGHGGGGSGGFSPIYTDDAATKLSDRVRRRCFNCCTTDTSTWRRSSLNPGKVLCNKCGLFERTHSRPRPDQFPHKRGPLTTPAFPTRSPTMSHEGPGVMAANASHSSPQQLVPSQSSQNSLPPTSNHPSLASSYSHPAQLPQIQEWLRNPGAGGSSSSSSPGVSAAQSRGASSSSADRHHGSPGSGAGSNHQSPQNANTRLPMRANSGHSEHIDTPPQRTAQNLTPSPSPPPETSRIPVTSPRDRQNSGSEGGNQ